MAKVIKNKSSTERTYFGIDIPATTNHTIALEDLLGLVVDPDFKNDLLTDAEIVLADSADLATEYDGQKAVDFLFKTLVTDLFSRKLDSVFFSDADNQVQTLAIATSPGLALTTTGIPSTPLFFAATPGNQGRFLTFRFFGSGTVKDKWLDVFGNQISSDIVPITIPFDITLTGLSYANEKQDTSVDLEIHKNGTAPGDKIFTWAVRNKRNAFKTNALSGTTFKAGDRLLVFAREATGGTFDPTAVVLYLTFSIDNNVLAEGGQQNDF